MRFLTKTEMYEMWTDEDNKILANIAIRFIRQQARVLAENGKRNEDLRNDPEWLASEDVDDLWIKYLNL